uniref:Uncharacterized protein n=1 Tax=viral metagenome TaxID=1070528 RepID=A0A6M3K3L3_9ZZZZ
MENEEMSEEQREELFREISAEEFGSEEPEKVVEKSGETPEAKAWDKVDPAVKKMYDELENKLKQAALEKSEVENRLKQAERRIGGISNELSKTAKNVEGSPTEKAIAEASKNLAKWEELKKDFPEWAEGVEAKLAATLSDLKGKDVNIRSEMDTAFDRKLERRLLSMFHPGYEQTIKSTEYQSWLKEQPKEIQTKAATSWRADDAIQILDDYAKARGSAKSPAEIGNDRMKRLRGSVMPQGKKPAAVREKSDDELTVSEMRDKIFKEVYKE